MLEENLQSNMSNKVESKKSKIWSWVLIIAVVVIVILVVGGIFIKQKVKYNVVIGHLQDQVYSVEYELYLAEKKISEMKANNLELQIKIDKMDLGFNLNNYISVKNLLRDKPEVSGKIIIRGVVYKCNDKDKIYSPGCYFAGVGGGTIHIDGMQFKDYIKREIIVEGDIKYCKNKETEWLCGLSNVQLLKIIDSVEVSCEDYRYGSCPKGCIQDCVSSYSSGGMSTGDCGGEGSCRRAN